MKQTFLVFGLSDASYAKAVTVDLSNRGYAVGDANRMVKPSLQIRIREDTGDRDEVEQVVASIDPQAVSLPSATPSMNLVGYREGY